eukprot:gene4693-856_t
MAPRKRRKKSKGEVANEKLQVAEQWLAEAHDALRAAYRAVKQVSNAVDQAHANAHGGRSRGEEDWEAGPGFQKEEWMPDLSQLENVGTSPGDHAASPKGRRGRPKKEQANHVEVDLPCPTVGMVLRLTIPGAEFGGKNRLCCTCWKYDLKKKDRETLPDLGQGIELPKDLYLFPEADRVPNDARKTAFLNGRADLLLRTAAGGYKSIMQALKAEANCPSERTQQEIRSTCTQQAAPCVPTNLPPQQQELVHLMTTMREAPPDARPQYLMKVLAFTSTFAAFSQAKPFKVTRHWADLANCAVDDVCKKGLAYEARSAYMLLAQFASPDKLRMHGDQKFQRYSTSAQCHGPGIWALHCSATQRLIHDNMATFNGLYTSTGLEGLIRSAAQPPRGQPVRPGERDWFLQRMYTCLDSAWASPADSQSPHTASPPPTPPPAPAAPALDPLVGWGDSIPLPLGAAENDIPDLFDLPDTDLDDELFETGSVDLGSEQEISPDILKELDDLDSEPNSAASPPSNSTTPNKRGRPPGDQREDCEKCGLSADHQNAQRQLRHAKDAVKKELRLAREAHRKMKERKNKITTNLRTKIKTLSNDSYSTLPPGAIRSIKTKQGLAYTADMNRLVLYLRFISNISQKQVNGAIGAFNEFILKPSGISLVGNIPSTSSVRNMLTRANLLAKEFTKQEMQLAAQASGSNTLDVITHGDGGTDWTVKPRVSKKSVDAEEVSGNKRAVMTRILSGDYIANHTAAEQERIQKKVRHMISDPSSDFQKGLDLSRKVNVVGSMGDKGGSQPLSNLLAMACACESALGVDAYCTIHNAKNVMSRVWADMGSMFAEAPKGVLNSIFKLADPTYHRGPGAEIREFAQGKEGKAEYKLQRLVGSKYFQDMISCCNVLEHRDSIIGWCGGGGQARPPASTTHRWSQEVKAYLDQDRCDFTKYCVLSAVMYHLHGIPFFKGLKRNDEDGSTKTALSCGEFIRNHLNVIEGLSQKTAKCSAALTDFSFAYGDAADAARKRRGGQWAGLRAAKKLLEDTATREWVKDKLLYIHKDMLTTYGHYFEEHLGTGHLNWTDSQKTRQDRELIKKALSAMPGTNDAIESSIGILNWITKESPRLHPYRTEAMVLFKANGTANKLHEISDEMFEEVRHQSQRAGKLLSVPEMRKQFYDINKIRAQFKGTKGSITCHKDTSVGSGSDPCKHGKNGRPASGHKQCDNGGLCHACCKEYQENGGRICNVETHMDDSLRLKILQYKARRKRETVPSTLAEGRKKRPSGASHSSNALENDLFEELEIRPPTRAELSAENNSYYIKSWNKGDRVYIECKQESARYVGGRGGRRWIKIWLPAHVLAVDKDGVATVLYDPVPGEKANQQLSDEDRTEQHSLKDVTAKLMKKPEES